MLLLKVSVLQLESLDLVKTALDMVVNSVPVRFVLWLYYVKLKMIKENEILAKTRLLTEMRNFSLIKKSILYKFKIHKNTYS